MSFPDSLRKTKSRLKVWEILEKSATPLTARQIAQQASASGSGGESGKGVWLSSVYRALEAFEEAHVVSRTVLKDSPEALYSLSESGHHHYAICLGCKSRTDFSVNENRILGGQRDMERRIILKYHMGVVCIIDRLAQFGTSS